jgi:hypothetical protein
MTGTITGGVPTTRERSLDRPGYSPACGKHTSCDLVDREWVASFGAGDRVPTE